jgi:hypothetical protein
MLWRMQRMGEFSFSENMVPQQSLHSMSGISLAVWTMTVSYYVHFILKYNNTSYTFTSFFDIECKIIFLWYKLFQTFTAHLQLLTALWAVKSVWYHVQIPMHLGDSFCPLVSASILFLSQMAVIWSSLVLNQGIEYVVILSIIVI